MRCLCCGNEINSAEEESGWHKRCIKRFFGINTLPELQITKEQLQIIANDTVNKGYTVPGVQKKMSLHLSKCDGVHRLTIVDYPNGYILKPQTEQYESLPEYEDLAMRMAEIVKIKTVPHALMRLDSEYAYITKRIDRDLTGQLPELYAMEDFCQLSGRLTEDKYKGSYENCVKIARKYSIRPGIDASEILIRVLFSFIIGNSDMHLKNFSMRETEPGNRKFCLSDAYDLLPVNVILPADPDQMALTINGKKRNIHKNDFIKFAACFGMNKAAVIKIMKYMCSMENKYDQCIEESYLSKEQKEKMKQLVQQRIAILNCNYEFRNEV